MSISQVRKKLAVSLLAALSICALPAHGSTIDGMKGIGYASAIGGPKGLSFNFGVGRLAVETLLGFSRFSYRDNVPEPEVIFTGALGGHFQVLRAQYAAVTLGARFNIGTGKTLSELDAGNAAVSGSQLQTITQFGFDLPMRIYWFPDKHISIHTEFGIAFFMGSKDALLFSPNDGDIGLAPEGLAIVAFREATPVGQLGLTFWW